MTPNFFCISGTSNSLSDCNKNFKKFYRVENFRANVLKFGFLRIKPLQKPCTIKTCSTLDQNRSGPDQKIIEFIHSINLKKAGVGQPKYCNNAYVHVVLTNLCRYFLFLNLGVHNPVEKRVRACARYHDSRWRQRPGHHKWQFKFPSRNLPGTEQWPRQTTSGDLVVSLQLVLA